MFIRKARCRSFVVLISIVLSLQIILFVKIYNTESGSTEVAMDPAEVVNGKTTANYSAEPGKVLLRCRICPAHVDSQYDKYGILDKLQDSVLLAGNNGTWHVLKEVSKRIGTVTDRFKRLKEMESALFTSVIGTPSDSECVLPVVDAPVSICTRDIKWNCSLSKTFSHFDRSNGTIYVSCPGVFRVNFKERTESEYPLSSGQYVDVPKWQYIQGPATIPMKSTYADIVCKDNRNQDMHNYHTQFLADKKLNQKQLSKFLKIKKQEPDWKPQSILVVTLDSLSRAHAHRKCGLPLTMKLLKQLYRDPLIGYPTMYSHKNSLKFAKDIKEWLWQYAGYHGYLTFYGIDNSSGMMGTRTPCKDCHYRPPTLPHAQHGWLKKENTQIDVNTWSGLCDGNGMLHDYLLNFTKEFLQQDHPAKWAAIDLNAGHRAEDESINQVDRELAEFLRSVLSENNNLTVFILGDHGKTYQSFPSHIGGYYETQLPFLSIILPNKLLDENPSMVDVLIVNQERYIVQSDLHKTMKSLIQYPLAVSGSVAPQAINILTDIIPRNRTCEEAGLPSWSCVCGTMKKMSDFEWQEKHTRMAQLALDFVNAKHKQLKKKNISSCLDLHLSKINHIFMNENPSSNSEWTTLYQITFQTIEKLTTWQAVVDDLFDIKQVKHVSLYQRFEVCQDKEVPLQYCVCDHPTN
ncbi:LOW QUALITY PROTEIN: uncharacterized protein LOC102801711 [Saccoglossus kowalevskii]